MHIKPENTVQLEGLADTPAEMATFVFTIGCFDLLHDGHRRLFANMRRFGHRLVIGIHDDESIWKLKNKMPMDDTQTRLKNVAMYADYVYVIAGTDPTPFIEETILRLKPLSDSMVYVRGNDMPNFPSRPLVESHMPVKLLPYTDGVSSTMLRKKLLHGKTEKEISVLFPHILRQAVSEPCS
mmetsp:Transcript_52444/g.131879  ORF Transcript_52444/g.131879 Transcript_52444/m.131879 type:complete len:182 (-) Transcript_52444:348-893(-)|eukprot:CAMPEP_0177654374 /NCGR_PEP_ID=MMETSP0447-20121125/14291_1 /TAXON_ID=0 /ORGANISM="Stygamoeba regulata, Strain BSH-02190019" /LENGTH=181 /DNA_ID=CAMNT_0019158005 /DNA_START=197 /DNA_END=742 /DNA_ORIENTATION=-